MLKELTIALLGWSPTKYTNINTSYLTCAINLNDIIYSRQCKRLLIGLQIAYVGIIYTEGKIPEERTVKSVGFFVQLNDKEK